MKKIGTTMIIVLLVILGASLIINNSNQAKSQEKAQTNLPVGEWSFSAGPYQGDGYDTRDVVVTSVTTDSRKGLAITKVGLKNQSGKPVSAVKFRWILFRGQDRHLVLAQGDTPLIALSGGIPTDEKRVLEYPVTSFGKISRPLQNGGALYGSFRLEVEVSEIQYDEVSKVQQKNNFAKSFADAKRQGKVFAAAKTTVMQTCPKQLCKFITGRSGDGYTCDTSTNNEYCENHQTTCTAHLCGN